MQMIYPYSLFLYFSPFLKHFKMDLKYYTSRCFDKKKYSLLTKFHTYVQ
jgi:hypothetical protein